MRPTSSPGQGENIIEDNGSWTKSKDKILDLSKWKGFAYIKEKKNLSKLKAFADDRKVTQKLKFVMGWMENIVGKGENACYLSIFSFSHNVFNSFLFQRH